MSVVDPAWQHRKRFEDRRRRAEQEERAREQFGPRGLGIPPTDDDPEPTKAPATSRQKEELAA